MPARTIYYFPGGVYHLYNRGAHAKPIFSEPNDYRYVQSRLAHYLPELSLSLIAYCLLPNHYHFLVQQDGDTDCGLLPQRIFNGYRKYYNKRYQHHGTLFESRYKVRQVLHEAQLLHTCRYIHANPVKHQLVKDYQAWPYSNWQDWRIGDWRGDLVPGVIQEYFADRADYEQFVTELVPGTLAVPGTNNAR